MKNFDYFKAPDSSRAVSKKYETGSARASAYLGGGTNLIDMMRLGTFAPDLVIDLARTSDLDSIEFANGHLRIGAMSRLSQVATHAIVSSQYPLLTVAIEAGLTPQLRNAATMGGNLMQHPRCYYYREPGFLCHRHQLGSGCAAQSGVHYSHAIFGENGKKDCIAVFPSDMATALVALDAKVEYLLLDQTTETKPLEEILLPAHGSSQTRNSLPEGALITAVHLPARPLLRRGFSYTKGPPEGFALVSLATEMVLNPDLCTIETVTFVMGGVASSPIKSRDCERSLVGSGKDAFQDVAELALKDAHFDQQTNFRRSLGEAVILKALNEAWEIALGEGESK